MEVIEQATSMLLLLTLTLLAGVAVVFIAEKIGLPDIVLLLLAGLVLGPITGLINIPADSIFNQIILLGGAAYILFHGGTTIDFRVVSQVWKTIVLLAIPGVLITAAIVGGAASYLLGFPILLALLLAIVLAPTDPASLIPIFSQVRIRPKVAQTVISESTFNDATAASFALVLIPVVLGTSAFSLSSTAGGFGLEAGVGIVVGLALGLLFVIAVTERYRAMATYASKLSIVAAILAFVLADVLHGSGFMAAFLAGLIIGNSDYFDHPIESSVVERLHHFMDSNASILRIFIFILLGSHVNFVLLREHLWEGLAVVAVLMFIARPLTILACALPDRKGRWEWRELLFLFWVRETGVIPAALAGVLVALRVPQADVIASITFLAVLITILIQASSTRFVATKLGLLDAAYEEKRISGALEKTTTEP